MPGYGSGMKPNVLSWWLGILISLALSFPIAWALVRWLKGLN